MYKTLLALLFSGIGLLLHADNSYLIQARHTGCERRNRILPETIQHAADYKCDATRRRQITDERRAVRHAPASLALHDHQR